VIFWSSGTRTEEDANGVERERYWMTTRAYTVFNVEQCDDLVRDYLLGEPVPSEFEPLEACERICAGYEITTEHGGDRAYYQPARDKIRLPNRERFETPEGYYTTRFHEMGHSTGHASRLGREGITTPGAHKEVHTYAEEELVAEFCASFLAGEAGIERTMDNSAAYLSHWASKLKEDKRLVVKAAQRAQKAADLILGRQPSKKAGGSQEAGEAVSQAA